MSGWYFAAFAIGATAIWMVHYTWTQKKWQRSLADSRAALTRDQFIAAMESVGVKAATATFLLDELDPYYYRPLKPDPSDRVYSTLAIDPDDIADIVEKHWGDVYGLADPAENVVVPNDPSLAELGQFLDALTTVSSGPMNSVG